MLENVKRIAEKATGWRRPDDPQALFANASHSPTDLRMMASFPIIRNGRLLSTRARSGYRNLWTPQLCLRSCLTAADGVARGATHLCLCSLSFAHP